MSMTSQSNLLFAGFSDRSATTSPQSSCPKSRPKESSSLILCQEEWIVGVLVMVLLVYLRSVHYQQGSWLGMDDWNENVFRDDWNIEEISSMLQSYCAVDLEILCANQGEYYRMGDGCQSSYGPFLTRKLNIYPTLDSNKLEGWSRDVVLHEQGYYSDRSDATDSSAPDELLHKCALPLIMQTNGWADLVAKGYPSVTKSDLEVYIQNKTLLLDVDTMHVARAILMVISSIKPNQHYSCSHPTNRRWISGSGNDYDLMFATDEEKEALYEFYLKEMLDVFATEKAAQQRLVSRTWTVTEFLDIAWAASKLLPYHEGSVLLHLRKAIAKIIAQQAVQEKESFSQRQLEQSADVFTPDNGPTRGTVSSTMHLQEVLPSEQYVKHEFHLFPCNDMVDKCMYSYYESQTMVTEICPKRMIQAQSRVRELEFCPLSQDFIFYIHSSFLFINIAWILMLFQGCSIRNLYKQNLEKKRRQLEQELNDPFLRGSLEQKACKLSESERIQFIAALERKVQHWDTSAGAAKHAKRWLRQLRSMMLFVILLNVCFGLLLIKWQVESRAQFLESVFVGVLMWTLSYAIKVPESKDSFFDRYNIDSGVRTLQMTEVGKVPDELCKDLLRESNEMSTIPLLV
ncbi:hypothetical protein IV203_034489 [Nitzschia inconspicua]|uniref:Uncharacterized protein n=1 Tax=Nitzschia inconspicua TaxID=303405 RepID=A0A9K3P9J5_9STRA|nr:hypothetical protein IV203_002546 [Nitzschia inconspicua]KAG7359391.1 hypothetical protein IV203_034489 [Nitzschia inconspicua]